MPSNPTPRNSVERKLHRVALESNSEKYQSRADLARQIASERNEEFSYRTAEGTKYANADTIAHYINLAVAIGILDENLECVRPKSEIRAQENFNSWLSNSTMLYVAQQKASPKEIARASEALLSKDPKELPIIENLRNELGTPLSVSRLRSCLQIVANLRPSALTIKGMRAYLSPYVFRT